MVRSCAVLVGLAIALTGCTDSKSATGQNRGQIGGEDSTDADAFATVGMKTMPDNMGPIAVSGVGLVYRLPPGMGSAAQPGSWRQMLEMSLKKQGFTHLKELLEDPNKTTSLVLVSAVIPPGARKGELVDVQITLPEDSRTTSLKGGVLLACDLVDYDTAGNLRSMVKDGRPSAPEGPLMLGSVWAKAEGPLVAGSMVSGKASDQAERRKEREALEAIASGKTNGEIAEALGLSPRDVEDLRARAATDDLEPPSLRAGRIWSGARVTQPRPYYFMMKAGDQSIRMASNVAERLNTTFHANGDPGLRIAEAKTRELVIVSVPYSYRNNHHRYLLVARQVPINPVSNDSVYRRKLEDELHNPATAITAAIKLEALGVNSRQAFRVALNNTSPWVRFAAAEALAYLGHTDGAAELARLAEDHPALRPQCLKALAASDDAAFSDRLVDLMSSSDPTLRYGAYIALRLSNEANPAIAGHLLNHSLWLHRVAPGSPGLIHITGDRRAEIVLFGDGVKFNGPFTLPVGPDFTVSMADDEVKITKIVSVAGNADVKEQKCPADVAAVLATLCRLGGGYSEAVELLRRADAAQRLTAAVAFDAVPRQFSAQQLDAYAKKDPALIKANVEVTRVGASRTDLETAGVDFADPEAEAKPDAAVRPPLSRQPGRIFGPKPTGEPVAGETLQPVTPAGGTAPPEPAPVSELSRNPGRLFPKK